MTTTLTADGQITLPAEIRTQLRLSEGDRLDISVSGEGKLILARVLPISSLGGLLAAYAKGPSTLEEMDEAMARGIAEHVDSAR